MSDAESRLRRVVQHAPIVLWAIDLEGTFTLSEGQGLGALGLAPGEAVGRSVFEMYKDFPDVLADLVRALGGEEFSALAEIGDSAFETRYCPLRDEHNRVTGLLGLSIDVSARLRAERERTSLQAQLMQAHKLESLGQLAGGIAHDFNNLLTAILGSASAAERALPQSHAARAPLENVMLAAQHAATLTHQLLAYAGKARFEIRRVDLAAQVRELGSLLGTAIPKHVKLRIQAQDALSTVEVDVAQLKQVVMNLVINAAESVGDDHGSVLVTIGSEQIAVEQPLGLYGNDVLPAGSYVALQVEDTGSGMSEDTLAKIFDPFFTTKFAGRGLGLAAVLGIVRAHRGGLQVVSTIGRGTSFKILFPAHAGAATETVDSGPEAHGHGHILLVDDDMHVRSAIQAIVELLGYSVETAVDGRDGVTRLANHPNAYTLVLLDMTMPEMNGEETFLEMRRLQANLPIVLMSGYTESDAMTRLTRQGRADFVHKPFTLAELAAALQRVQQPTD
jgi:PAS domain S-box-containing protein